MRRRVVIQVVGFLLIAGAAAFAVLPARWAMSWVPSNWPLSIVDADGTVWQGRATIAVGVQGRMRTVPTPIKWRLVWRNSGWVPRPQWYVKHPWLNGPLLLTPGLSGVGLSGQTLEMPASVLSTLDARIAAMDPGGLLRVNWPASFLGKAERGQGAELLRMDWLNASSSLTRVHPMGQYVLTLKQGGPGVVDMELKTTGGPLLLEGGGVIQNKTEIVIEVMARSAPDVSAQTHAALQDLLATLGPYRNGETRLRYRSHP
ncbi:MAG: type II secretion system protein N [Pusillimonas sp.]|nr:type II secretion system protein N [Pusillimonas sp.]